MPYIGTRPHWYLRDRARGLYGFVQMGSDRFNGLDLNFAARMYALNGPYSSQFPTGWSFSRTDTNGTATALTAAGAVQSFATGIPRITDRGLLIEESRTNKGTNFSANPDAPLTNVALDGGSAVLSRVLDVAALDAAGLSGVATSGYVIKLDNSGQATASRFSITGTPGNTNVHTVSAWVRGSGNVLFRQGTAGTVFLASTALTAGYVRLSGSAAPGITSGSVRYEVAAGSILYLILPQFEEGSFATSPIITTGSAGTRGLDAAAITVPAGVSAYTATYNGGLTATGSVTPGASFNLVTGRPWLNGYLQRLVMQ